MNRNPDKFKDYFSKKPTKKQVQKAIDNTDILEQIVRYTTKLIRWH